MNDADLIAALEHNVSGMQLELIALRCVVAALIDQSPQPDALAALVGRHRQLWLAQASETMAEEAPIQYVADYLQQLETDLRAKSARPGG